MGLSEGAAIMPSWGRDPGGCYPPGSLAVHRSSRYPHLLLLPDTHQPREPQSSFAIAQVGIG